MVSHPHGADPQGIPIGSQAKEREEIPRKFHGDGSQDPLFLGIEEGEDVAFLVQEHPEHTTAPRIPLQLPAGQPEFPLGILQPWRLLLWDGGIGILQGIPDLLGKHAQLPAGSISNLHFPVAFPLGKAFPGHGHGPGVGLGSRIGAAEPVFVLDGQGGVGAVLIQGQRDLGGKTEGWYLGMSHDIM